MLFGLELVKDRNTKEPARTEGRRVVNELLRRGVMATHLGGYYGNVIKLGPPLVITRQQLDFALEQLDSAIGAVERSL